MSLLVINFKACLSILNNIPDIVTAEKSTAQLHPIVKDRKAILAIAFHQDQSLIQNKIK